MGLFEGVQVADLLQARGSQRFDDGGADVAVLMMTSRAYRPQAGHGPGSGRRVPETELFAHR